MRIKYFFLLIITYTQLLTCCHLNKAGKLIFSNTILQRQSIRSLNRSNKPTVLARGFTKESEELNLPYQPPRNMCEENLNIIELAMHILATGTKNIETLRLEVIPVPIKPLKPKNPWGKIRTKTYVVYISPDFAEEILRSPYLKEAEKVDTSIEKRILIATYKHKRIAPISPIKLR